MTVTQLLTAALSRLGIPGIGQTPRQEDLDVAFDRLNQWIDALANDGLTVFTITRTTWTLTSSASITVGSGGTVNIPRPVSPQSIHNIGYVDASVTPNQEHLFGECLTEADYQAIPIKTYSSTYPSAFYYSPTLPTGTLKPWPQPSGSSLLGVIYADAPVAEFAAQSDVISVPNGWRRYLINGLAVELAPEFGKQVDPVIASIAQKTEASIKRTNARLVDLEIDPAVCGPQRGSNIYTGI